MMIDDFDIQQQVEEFFIDEDEEDEEYVFGDDYYTIYPFYD